MFSHARCKCAQIPPARPNHSSPRLTLYIVDILLNFRTNVIGTYLKKLIMTNVQIRTWLYACATRGVRQPPLSRDVQEQGARDQMRRLGDVVIACILLAITLPLMIIVCPGDQMGEPRSRFEQAQLHWPRRPVFSDAEISDRRARSDTRHAGMGRAEDYLAGPLYPAHPYRGPSAAHQCAPR